MRRLALALLTLFVAGSALAVKSGETLYVRSRNTRLVDKPKGRVVTTLQPGDAVTWLGKATEPGWHQVQLKNGKKGVLLTANLATQPPPMELRSSSGKPIDQGAFLSSGAATRALAPLAAEYGRNKSMDAAVRDVTAMEQLSDSVTLGEVAKHAAAVGLPEAVGGEKR